MSASTPAPTPGPTAPEQRTPERILHRLDWHVIRRLDGLFQGDYRTLFYGHGLDFADLREYQPQDDIRHIDWNVTARMNSPYVRNFIEEREITAWFLLDLSASMGFGPEHRPKEMVLVDFVTTLARLLTRSGNRVGAILYNNRIERTIPPRTGRNQVLRLTRDLLRETDPPPGASTDLTVLLHSALNMLKRRALVFLVSDFISEPGWEEPLALLNRRHDLLAIRLFDPQEMELPDAGLIVVEDAETGEHLYVDTGDPDFRRRFYEAAQRRESDLKARLRRAGVGLHAMSTGDDLIETLVRIAHLRKLQRR